jgi:thioester reductase-like protein
VRGPRVEVVVGDVTKPDLGLRAADRRRLAREVTEVVHAAAATKFDLPLDESRRTNVEGTRNLLAFAERCAVDRFVHVSTAYVAGTRVGTIAERPVSRPPGFVNTYERSKHEAEEVVHAAAAHLPCRVLRISTIAGDSKTGEVLQWNYCHRVLRLAPRSPFPIAPLDPDARIDLVPTDWALDALAALVDADLPTGAVRHVCAGRANSSTGEELLSIVRERHGRAGGRAARLDPPPRFVPLAEWRTFVEEESARADPLTRAVLEALDTFVPHLALRQDFATERTTADLGPLGPSPPARGWFARVVDHGIATGWGRATRRRAAPTAEGAPASLAPPPA